MLTMAAAGVGRGAAGGGSSRPTSVHLQPDFESIVEGEGEGGHGIHEVMGGDGRDGRGRGLGYNSESGRDSMSRGNSLSPRGQLQLTFKHEFEK